MGELSEKRREALERKVRSAVITWNTQPVGVREDVSEHLTDALSPLLAEWSAQDRAAGHEAGVRAAVREIGDVLVAAWQSSDNDLMSAMRQIEEAAKADVAAWDATTTPGADR